MLTYTRDQLQVERSQNARSRSGVIETGGPGIPLQLVTCFSSGAYVWSMHMYMRFEYLLLSIVKSVMQKADHWSLLEWAGTGA